MTRTTLFVAFVTTVFAVLIVSTIVLSETSKAPIENTGAQATVVPVLHLNAASDMEVSMIFENTSSQTIGYLLDSDDKGVARLEISLFKDGQHIRPIVPLGEPPVVARYRVKELKSGQGVPHSWKLKDLYGELKPGRYELRVRYDHGSEYLQKEYGITPLTSTQKMYLDIR